MPARRESTQRGGGLGGEVDGARRSLAPFQGRGESVDDRLDPLLAVAGPAQLEEVPPRQGRWAARAEVDFNHLAAQLRLAQVGPESRVSASP